jgi:hypothetical protein
MNIELLNMINFYIDTIIFIGVGLCIIYGLCALIIYLSDLWTIRKQRFKT